MPGQTATLSLLSIGLNNVEPNMFFLSTTFSNAEIQVPGFLNGLTTSAQKTPANGDFVLSHAIDGGEYYVVMASPTGVLTLTPAGGVAGGFSYINTYWLAQNGNDANDGKSIDSPKLTLNNVASLLVPGTPTVINIVDSAIYPISSIFTVSCPLLINAPAAQLSWAGPLNGDMFFLNTSSPLIVNAALINGANTLQIFRGFSNIFVTGPSGYCNIVNATRIWEDANTLSPQGVAQAIFNITTEGGDFVFKFAGQQVINALNLGTSNISSQLISGSRESVAINAVDFSGSLSGTADFNLTCSYLAIPFASTTTGVVNFNVAKCNFNATTLPGTFTGSIGTTTFTSVPYLFTDNIFLSPVSLNSQPVLGEIYDVFFITPPAPAPWSFSPGNGGSALQGSNQHLIITNAGGAITLPDGTGLPSGYRFTASQSVAGGVIVHASGSDTMSGQNGINPGTTTCYTGIGKMEFINGTSNGAGGNTWAVVNCFTTSSLTQTNVFISQIEGNDSTANGNIDSQFATINAAKAYVIATYTATPAYGINLVITDDAIYNEKLDFTGTSNIHIVGRTAEIVYASSGPGDDGFTSNSPQQFISTAALSTSGGGKAVNYTGGGALILNVDVLGNGNVENNGAGTIFAQTYVLQGTTVNSGGGRFAYTAIQRSGPDGAGVIGTSVLGASGNWTVLGTLMAKGLTYPLTDGLAGYVVTTDGAGNLTLQAPPSGGALIFNTVAGVSQLAVAGNAYICANAAQTTVTLPAICAVGATVRVYGQGAAGWVLQANGGQTINLGTVPTSVGGTLTSAANTDLVEVSCLVANTTWQVNYTFSSGLTPA